MAWYKGLFLILLLGIFDANAETSKIYTFQLTKQFDAKDHFQMGPYGDLKYKLLWPYQETPLPLLLKEHDFPLLIKQEKQALSYQKHTVQELQTQQALPFKIWQDEMVYRGQWVHQGPPDHKKLTLIILIFLLATLVYSKFKSRGLLIYACTISILLLSIPNYKTRLYILEKESSWLITLHQPKAPYASFQTKDSSPIYLKKLPKANYDFPINEQENLPLEIKTLSQDQAFAINSNLWSTDYIIKNF